MSELVLITGGTGFIASWIVKFALDQGFRVRASVRDPSNEKKLEHLKQLKGANERLEFVKLDLSESPKQDFIDMCQGVTMVLHTASPFPDRNPKDHNVLVKPAVRGTTSVLEACKDVDTIQRVVITSSTVSMGEGTLGSGLFYRHEKDWTDDNTTSAYPKSKTLAEKAAWDFYKAHNPKWSLCTVNPGLVLGPSLSPETTTSTGFPARLMNGEFPMAMRVAFPMVDVRDVAMAHIKCLTTKEKIQGRRFVLVNETQYVLFMANALRNEFLEMGYNKLPTKTAPNFVVKFLRLFDRQLASLELDSISIYDNFPSRSVLGIEYTDMSKSVTDAGHSAVFHGLVPRTSRYKPPKEGWTPENSL